MGGRGGGLIVGVCRIEMEREEYHLPRTLRVLRVIGIRSGYAVPSQFP